MASFFNSDTCQSQKAAARGKSILGKHSDSEQLKNWTKIFVGPMSLGASRAERSEASSAERAVRSKRTSEWWERTSERMSKWPITFISISKGSESLWERGSFPSFLERICSHTSSIFSFFFSLVRFQIISWPGLRKQERKP